MPARLLTAPIPPATLDADFANGYYRYGQMIDTDWLMFTPDGGLAQLIWARIRLAGFSLSAKHQKEASRCAGFSLTRTPGQHITPEAEALYARYKATVNFEASASVQAYLMGEATENFFPTATWHLRDNGKLIATGYTEEGQESMAGILNFYDPAYARYAPGKFLYYATIRYAAAQGKAFFYPGYIAVGYAKFDYKLDAGKDCIELWDKHAERWRPYEDLRREEEGP